MTQRTKRSPESSKPSRSLALPEVPSEPDDDRLEVSDDAGEGNEIQSMSIAVRILEMLATERKEMKAASIARGLSMTPPRAWRHLRSMSALGLVDKSSQTGAFRLGWRLVQLGQSAAEQYSVTDVAHPYLVELRDQLNLTTFLTLPYQDGSVVAQCIPGGTQLSLTLHPGTYFAFHASSTSRVILAFSSAERQAHILAGPLPADSEPDPITSPRALKARLELIRDRFFDTVSGASPYPVTGISAPVFDHNNDVVAAVCILSWRGRDDNKSIAALAEKVCDAAARASSALGSVRWQQRKAATASG